MKEISLEVAKEMIQMLRDGPLTEYEESQFVNLMPKPTINTIIKNLFNKKCLIETDEEFYEVDSRVKLYYKYCL